MDSDGRVFQYFLDVYGTLPRAGPGGDEHTARALSLVPARSIRNVLDLGCGPGAQTVVLADRLPDARIVAVDRLAPMVAETNRRLLAAGVDDRATAIVGDMNDPPVGHDLIWCEGAIYNLGVTPALNRWRSVLVEGGVVAFTEPVWLVPEPPSEIREWWLAEYPAMTDRAGVATQIAAAHHRTVSSFVLPASAWWDEYYLPMHDRIADLRDRRPGDPEAEAVAAAAETEIAMFERFSDSYSYEFFVVEPEG